METLELRLGDDLSLELVVVSLKQQTWLPAFSQLSVVELNVEFGVEGLLHALKVTDSQVVEDTNKDFGGEDVNFPVEVVDDS